MPQKSIYFAKDLKLVGAYWGIPLQPPKICKNLNISEVKDLLEATQSSKISNLLKERTNEVLKLGAFGLPWITLKRTEDEETLSFWGSDRLPIICDLLGKEFCGPLKEENLKNKI
uniref:DSBA domain-containing protein n=1 Tax=Meloidogyne hapla TaxID=6305 RepID=A0A1I8BUV2_MELHA